MMTNEDVKRLDAIAHGELVKQLNEEIASLKAKLKENGRQSKHNKNRK